MDNAQTNVGLTVDVITAYLANNKVEVDQVPALIASIHSALAGLGQSEPEPNPEEIVEKPSAAQIRKSITDAGLTSVLDGKIYQSLKRHLTRHNMTPADYRERFGLKADYPMVSPAYSARRSALAKEMGLGARGRQGGKTAAKTRASRKMN